MKLIFVTGGVFSSLGKGVAMSSIATLLKQNGFKIKLKKLDPYINVDSGNMNPYEHGECFVTQDGVETDLDLGCYEKFTEINTNKDSIITGGKVFSNVIEREKLGGYHGVTVQIVPHITNEIKNFILSGTQGCDYILCEIGGTVGDIEGLYFLEAVRQLIAQKEYDVVSIHMSYIPYLKTTEELKTKPTQRSVKELLSYGIMPNLLICRLDRSMPDFILNKISLMCNVSKKNIFALPDLKSIYDVPQYLYSNGMFDSLLKLLDVKENIRDVNKWQDLSKKIHAPKKYSIDIALVAKYADLLDSYKSVLEALNHAAWQNEIQLNIVMLNSRQEIKKETLAKFDGFVIPGGFGTSGTENAINSISLIRKMNKPIFGICLGFQLMLVEWARNKLAKINANSTEFDKNTDYPVITKHPTGEMQLGEIPLKLLDKQGIFHRAYGNKAIHERFRHRYIFNEMLAKDFAKDIKFGLETFDGLMVGVQFLNKQWDLGVQFHPEFTSTPFHPNPIFNDFIKFIKEKKLMIKEVHDIKIGNFHIGNDLPLVAILGPCVIESLKHATFMCNAIKEICLEVGINYIYKSSYDKANRTSGFSFRGLGIDKGLEILAEVKEKFQVPITTDVHSEDQCKKIAEVADILQIPAFLSRQTDLLTSAAKTGKIVNIKKGQFLSPQDMQYAAQKVSSVGNNKIMLSERGTSFGYNNLVVDMKGLSIMKETGYPVVLDATHSVQNPGALGGKTGGDRNFVPVLAKAGVSVGIAAVFMEVHEDPDAAPSDGPNMIKLNNLHDVLMELKELDSLIKRKK